MRKCFQIFILALVLQVALIGLFYIKKTWTIYLTEKLLNPMREHIITTPENLTDLSEDDQIRLVNFKDFNYTISKQNTCDLDSNLLLLIIVSSAPENIPNRQAIRETWGKKDPEVKIIFTFGLSDFDDDLRTEDSSFGDIIQGNFIDSYENMTYKGTMGLKWAVYNCPRVKFVMKCDDDVFVNMPLLKNFLKNDLSHLSTSNALFCNVNYGMEPVRDPDGIFRKWYVSYQDWPEKTYPTYCSGWYALMTLNTALEIYKSAQNTSFFWVDDVFLTGVAARRVPGLTFVDLYKYTLVNVNYESILNGTHEDEAFLFGGINMDPKLIRLFWQYVLSHPVRESILKSFGK